MARLDLSQSAKNWYKISQRNITGTFVSQPFIFACSRKEKSNKQQPSNWSDRRGGEISLECRGMNEKGTHRVLARDYFGDS